MTESIFLCASADLLNSADAVPFQVLHWGRPSAAFAIRYQGQVYAYLNRCAHVPVEMDDQPNRFFDSTGHWLMCSMHGALYQPQTGACQGGPCRGGLLKISLFECDGVVHWHTAPNLKPLEF
jgi:nitrite reductase/ring-hydroxylating ferredoxin subunit